MVWRTDNLCGMCHVSFETTRFSPHLLIDAYQRLVSMVRRVWAEIVELKN